VVDCEWQLTLLITQNKCSTYVVPTLSSLEELLIDRLIGQSLDLSAKELTLVGLSPISNLSARRKHFSTSGNVVRR